LENSKKGGAKVLFSPSVKTGVEIPAFVTTDIMQTVSFVDRWEKRQRGWKGENMG